MAALAENRAANGVDATASLKELMLRAEVEAGAVWVRVDDKLRTACPE